MKKVLVTGATGFIGRHCLDLLADQGFEIHAVHLGGPISATSGVVWHECDLLAADRSAALMAKIKPTHMLHFAWYAVPNKYLTSIENIRWLQASLDLLINFEKHGGSRAVLAGTCAEYDWNYEYCSEETTPLRPQTLYGACKNSLQQVLSQFSRQTGISSAWGRIFFLYGSHEHPGRLVPYVICSLLQDKPAHCTHGNYVRDFLHVQDVASAFVALLESAITGPVNIASGSPVALEAVVNTIADKLDKRELVRFGQRPSESTEPGSLTAEVKRLNNEVGWTPTYDLDQGLAQTIAWWKDQR